MSKGPGRIEQRIADLFAATRDRALSIDEITDNAYELGGRKPSREQRLSATRAAHRLLRRVREAHARARDLDPASAERSKLHEFCNRIGLWTRIHRVERKRGWLRGEADFWLATTVKGRLYFHPPDVPVRVWAVSIGRGGITWAEAEVVRVTGLNVMVRYAGEVARLDRQRLWYWWAFWRGVRFVSSRSGRIAAALDESWREHFGTAGGVPPSLQMPLADAIALLGVPADYTREDVISAFRKKAKQAHPDLGGTAEMFRKLVEARDRLLAAIGTKAAAPRPPSYYPKGTTAVYRSVRSTSLRLGRQSARLR